MSTTTRLYSVCRALQEVLDNVDEVVDGYAVEVENDDGELMLAQVSQDLADAIENAYYILNNNGEEEEEDFSDHNSNEYEADRQTDFDEAA